MPQGSASGEQVSEVVGEAAEGRPTRVEQAFRPASHPSEEDGGFSPEGKSPDAAVFHSFACAKARLAELHVNYKQQPEYPLERLENPNEQLNWRVEKMKLSKDKTALFYNSFLTLKGIPRNLRIPPRQSIRPRMGHRPIPGLHRQTLRHHQRPQPRRRPPIHLRLIGQVITVSLETMNIVKVLPPLGVEQAATAS